MSKIERPVMSDLDLLREMRESLIHLLKVIRSCDHNPIEPEICWICNARYLIEETRSRA